MSDNKAFISRLEEAQTLNKQEFAELIAHHTEEDAQFLFERARAARAAHSGGDGDDSARGLRWPHGRKTY